MIEDRDLGNLDAVITPPATPEGSAGSANNETKALAPLTNTPEPSGGDKQRAGAQGNGAAAAVPSAAMETPKPPAKAAPAAAK